MIIRRLAAARAELRGGKTKAMIEIETAEIWAARAVAAQELYQATGDLGWFACAVEFGHEACEHAAGGPPGTLERIQAEMKALGC